MDLNAMLSGYKTYLVAAAAILGAVAGFASGSMDLGQALQLIITSLMGATIRHGVATAAVKK